MDEKSKSKLLSYMLRHGAEKEGLRIDSDGFVVVDELLAHRKVCKTGLGKPELRHIVESNDKKRFEIATLKGIECIRASQGHSIAHVDGEGGSLLRPIAAEENFDVVVHGTYSAVLPQILANGLNRMSRNHIHFAPGYPESGHVISGMRKSCDVYIEINMRAAILDGIPFYQASNGVILSSGIDGILDPKYFAQVRRADEGPAAAAASV